MIGGEKILASRVAAAPEYITACCYTGCAPPPKVLVGECAEAELSTAPQLRGV
ncbi:MAG: hypothetical protein G01um101470_481 [Parcubacteria group bacterium Gr01-1014_70]|nr:MAG: hypothetical protein G01um101470_481 [Parcubacteria group bacterium Gr01-1014_70]